jgi:hypothetical protein
VGSSGDHRRRARFVLAPVPRRRAAGDRLAAV